ncbi:MAG TPA: WD40 repeat domain-containing protein, partial [Candidatus Kapabacteria bacterium]
MRIFIALLLVAIFASLASAQTTPPRWMRMGPLGPITSLNFTPDGQHLLTTADDDSRILLWNSSTGAYENEIPIPNFGTNDIQNYYRPSFTIAVAKAGDVFALSEDTTIYFIDFTSGTLVDSITRGVSDPAFLQFSSTSDTLVWVNLEKNANSTVYRYDRTKRELIDTFSIDAITSINNLVDNEIGISFSTDFKNCAYILEGDSTAILNFEDTTTKIFFTPEVQNIALNSTGSQLAVSGYPSEILDVSSGVTVFVWPVGSGPRYSMNMSYVHGSDTLLYPGDSSLIVHTSNGDAQINMPGSAWNVWAISNDGKTVATGTGLGIAFGLEIGPGIISLYHSPDYAQEQISGSTGVITQVEWCPVSDTITTSDFGGGINSYDARSGSLETNLVSYTRIGGFDYIGRSDSMAISEFYNDDLEESDRDGVWINGNHTITCITLGYSQYYQGLWIAPDKKSVVIQNILDSSSGDIELSSTPTLGYADVFGASLDGAELLIGDSRHVAVFPFATASLLNVDDPNHSNILSAALAQDQQQIAVAHADASVEILNFPSGNELYRLVGHTAPVTGVQYSHDGQYLISSSMDSTMIVWDLATGKAISTYRYNSPLYTAGFSYDNKYVAATDGVTAVLVWDAPASLGVAPVASALSLELEIVPNPVSTECNISFTLPMAESATLELYDGLGNRILSLPQGVVSAGGHSIAIGPGILRTLA